MSRAGLLVLALLPVPARAAQISIDPPPAWEDVTAVKGGGDVLVSLKGPETSSFVLAKVKPMSLHDHGLVRAFLIDILADVNEKTGLGFTLASNVNEATYDNGFTLYSINASYQGKPRLVLGLVRVGEETLLATLISAVPDTILPEVMQGLHGPAPVVETNDSAGKTESLDQQLAFELPQGFSSRDLAESERKMNFVLAVDGLGSELMIMKLVDDNTPVKEQPAIVRDTVLSIGGVDKTTLSDVTVMDTSAGPQLAYAWARVKDPTGAAGQFAAGYLPWCFWGYSVISKGPRAADLMTQLFNKVSLGSDAQAKLVETTPPVPVEPELDVRGNEIPLEPAVAVAVAVLILLIWALRRRRRS